MRTVKVRSIRTAIVFAASMALLAACSSGGAEGNTTSTSGGVPTDVTSDSDSLDELIQLAQEEGEVVIYHAPSEETVRDWVADFEEQYGITVVNYRAGGNEVAQRWAQETQAGRHEADVVIHSLPQLFMQADQDGWVGDFTPSSSDAFPEELKRDGRIYPLYLVVDGVGWNTNQVTEEERTRLMEEDFDALRDDTFAGRMALVIAQSGGTRFATYHFLTEVEADKYGWEYLEHLATLNPTIYDSGVPLVERLVGGEHAVSINISDTIAAPQVEAGAPIEWRYPNPASGQVFQMVVSANAPRPNAARLFMEWATSAEGQASVARVTQGSVMHADWVDDRTITEYDWYEAPEEVYIDWMFDEELFETHAEPMYARWNEVFNYQG